MNAEFARVYMTDIPYSADILYDYYIPPELSGRVFPGMLVSVPFGASNRRMRALVWSISDKTELEEVKPIASVSEDFPTLDKEQMDLCIFLKEYTLCTVGEALRSIVPSAAFSKVNEYISAASGKDYNIESGKLSEKALSVLRYVRECGRVSVQKLKNEFGEDVFRALSALVKEKYVLRTSDVTGVTNIKTVLSVKLAISPCEAIAAAEGAPGALRIRSVLQAEVLKALAAQGEMTSPELYEKIGCNSAHISSLQKKGLVICEKKEIYRNPFSGSCAPVRENIVLSDEQNRAYSVLSALYEEHEPKAALLFGVTGSGKTSVIKKMIDRVRADGKGVIMLVPEIALTPQAVSVFCGYYGESVSVLHSRLSAGERFDAWRKIRDGMSDIVIGTRSAVLAPVKNLGLIIIDEEQEHTYKSDSNPKYSAHDVARYRCKVSGSMLLLASATPSVTSFYKAAAGKYTLVEMKERFGGATLPDVRICDMRNELSSGNVSPLGMELISSLTETVERGNQAIVFLNRRGYHSSVTCMSCGETIVCPNCSVSMTYHTRRRIGSPEDDGYEERRASSGYLICHYCGHKERVPSACPSCGKEHFRFMGCGTQKVEEEILKLVPGAKVSRMDMDTTSLKSSHEKILEEFRSGKTNVLLGTQMVAKGHDFPKVTLVGILGADSSLYLDDYRAGENTFSMLTQVIGRAGRRTGEPGAAIVQTLNPYSDVIRLAAEQNYREFYKNEIRLRRSLAFPPFCDIALLTLSGSDEALLSASAVKLSERMRELLCKEFSDVPLQAFGPFESPVYKIQNVCRMRMVLKCVISKRLRLMLSLILSEFGRSTKSKVSLSIDLNPSSL